MEIIAKISKGSNMDQVYLPKNRIGFDIGNYVLIKPFEKKLLKLNKPHIFMELNPLVQ